MKKQKTIDELIALTDKQMRLVESMRKLYEEMQKEGIALALNDNEEIVAYNATHIADCQTGGVIFQNEPDGFEYADTGLLQPIFPVWGYENLLLQRK